MIKDRQDPLSLPGGMRRREATQGSAGESNHQTGMAVFYPPLKRIQTDKMENGGCCTVQILTSVTSAAYESLQMGYFPLW